MPFASKVHVESHVKWIQTKKMLGLLYHFRKNETLSGIILPLQDKVLDQKWCITNSSLDWNCSILTFESIMQIILRC